MINSFPRSKVYIISWRIIVEDYTSRKLTDPKDKLRAIAGIASRYNNAFEATRYICGMWLTTGTEQRLFLSHLMWKIRISHPIKTFIEVSRKHAIPLMGIHGKSSNVETPNKPDSRV